uniref:Uncharacterized protein n=1 Tax=Tetranychus urticae TaxID=32264 RepID=T1KN65_TETUR
MTFIKLIDISNYWDYVRFLKAPMESTTCLIDLCLVIGNFFHYNCLRLLCNLVYDATKTLDL